MVDQDDPAPSRLRRFWRWWTSFGERSSERTSGPMHVLQVISDGCCLFSALRALIPAVVILVALVVAVD